MKHELQSIISGKNSVRHGATISAAARYLEGSARTSALAKKDKYYKNKETEVLAEFVDLNHLWINNLDYTQFVSEGAEQRVYLVDSKYVIKLNDAIYYESWLDYFYNLLLHNYFFEDTAYSLEGFCKANEKLFAIVKQPFVKATEKTDLQLVKDFLLQNGFSLIRNNDYFHEEYGIILEDLHDENVLTQNGILQFIDTVFYFTPAFFNAE
jgi:hypothetical protein